MSEKAVLEARGISMRFTHRGTALKVLEDTSLVVHKAEVVVVVGPSGAGKTTLLRILAGLLRPTKGSVCLDGRMVSAPDSSRVMVFQESTVFPWMTVRQNIMYASSFGSSPAPDLSNGAIGELLDLAGLRSRLDDLPGTLSTGMRHLVELARALAARPKVLLGDEPFYALDAFVRRSVREILLGVIERYSPTMILTSHDVEEALLLGDRVLALRGNPASLRSEDEYRVSFPRPRGRELVYSSEFVRLRRRIEDSLTPTGGSHASTE